ncbi:MAG: hypothetical protein M1832_001267 [Thelocarpon impressellum]|nr:MAG: hypothetical protein M1832_001267 [Thelocarpon impressellum]
MDESSDTVMVQEPVTPVKGEGSKGKGAAKKATQPKTPTKSDTPKTPTKGADSDETTNGTGDGHPPMNETDSKFLLECLKHTKGSVTIDLDAVAKSLSYKNPRSVGNRLGVLKKMYGLTIVTSAASKDSGSAAGSPTKPEGVKKSRTPKKTAAAPKQPRKRAPKKSNKKASSGSDHESDEVKAKDVRDDEVIGDDEEMDSAGDDYYPPHELDRQHKANHLAGKGKLFPNLKDGDEEA